MIAVHFRLFAWLCLASLATAQNRFNPGLQPFVTVDAATIALEHVRVIDGTGAPPLENQTILIDHGKIATSSRPKERLHIFPRAPAPRVGPNPCTRRC